MKYLVQCSLMYALCVSCGYFFDHTVCFLGTSLCNPLLEIQLESYFISEIFYSRKLQEKLLDYRTENRAWVDNCGAS